MSDNQPQTPPASAEQKPAETPKPEVAPPPIAEAPQPVETVAPPVVSPAASVKPAEATPPPTPSVLSETPPPVATPPVQAVKPSEAPIPPTPPAVTTVAPEVDPAAITRPAASTGKTVLLVEDTTEMAEILQVTLQTMGVNVVHETHAAKALEIFKSRKPDLVLLDIGLPDMSGWKLLDGIKEMGKENRPPFIIITAYGDPANRLMGKLQDVSSYLIKPFSPDDIKRVVGKLLNLQTT